ncbi:hypothetical protein IFM89_033611 [Coptis chinensis]|uniref:Protein E6 n=1 Tax=Coptis chinensis TaxID=261450 RepID=A0A835I8E2_9MAGN|nr:hypothetical protein IFM89_033611 [Coptis chinensis]
MASPAKILCFLFLFFFISSPQIHARENQFFSKVSRDNTNTNINSGNNNVEVTELSPKKSISSHKQDEQPSFTQENHNGYGLYGRDMDQEAGFAYSSTPQKSTEEYNGGENSEYMFNNAIPYNSNNNNQEAGFTYSSTPQKSTKEYNGGENSEYMFNNGIPYNSNNNDNHYNGFETRQKRMKGNNGYYNYNNKNQYPNQQQGMSDTRFLENGRYYYDLNDETLHGQAYKSLRGSSKEVHTGNNQGYYANSDKLYKFNNFLDDNREGEEDYVP